MGLPTEYQQFIATSRYARWLPKEKRRETWEETVDRFIDFWRQRGLGVPEELLSHMRGSIYGLEVMPSMRCLMTAGPALARDNVAGFNCAAVAMDRQRSFDEIMYVLMCGTGPGYSVEQEFTNQLPIIAEEHYDSDTTIVVGDSKIGWASSFRELVSLLYSGKVPRWDMSKVRAEGVPLKVFGGRASGPGALVELFKWTTNTFRRFAGKRLPPIVVHDLCCQVAAAIVVGGVRRSACISLSDRDDKFMANAKSPQEVIEYTLLARMDDGLRKYSVIVNDAPYGDRSLILSLDDWESEQLQRDHTVGWHHVHPERALANNSIAYDGALTDLEFLEDWQSLVASYSGERGIFNRDAVQKQAARFGRRSEKYQYLCNPCSEIILRPNGQMCNLSEVVVKGTDTIEDIKSKVALATIIGTLQATLTDFRYLSSRWKKNTVEEALLGVSLTGIMDHPILGNIDEVDGVLPGILTDLRKHSEEVNEIWAERFGINRAAAITCVKPSGTVSQLVDSASGIHPRFAKYYIRTVRADMKDPLASFMKEKGFPCEPDVTRPTSILVFSFPMKVLSETAVYRSDLTAIEHLKLWKTYNEHWCHHKPSITVSVRPGEWLEVGAYVFKHFDSLSGVSFLPYDGGTYVQAPYQEINGEEYLEALEEMPKDVDWSGLAKFEEKDMTAGSKTMACSGNSCEIVDL